MKLFIELEIENDEVKSAKVIKPAEIVQKKEPLSIYARCFDAGCVGWSKNPECNLEFLRAKEMEANALLIEKGYLYLNEVYDMIGIPRTKAGQIVGWIYDEDNPIGNNFVDFRITMKRNGMFINGWDPNAWLDFNVDGNILELVED